MSSSISSASHFSFSRFSSPTINDIHAFCFRNSLRCCCNARALVVVTSRNLDQALQVQTNVRDKPAALCFTVGVEEGISASFGSSSRHSGNVDLVTTCDSVCTSDESSEDTLLSVSALDTEQLQAYNERTSSGARSGSSGAGLDSITILHQQLEKERGLDVSLLLREGTLDGGDTPVLLRKMKEMRMKSLQLLKKKGTVSRESGTNFSEEFTCAVDPGSLTAGDYVVHKTKGIGRFVCLKYDISGWKDSPEKYVYLQYADGMAKLKAKQATRLLYRYNQPGDRGKAPALSKLNDVRQWERKKNKGRLAVQKMVVDLMQLYVHRLRQRRPSYPKITEALARFAAKFPYMPTPDQEQAFIDVERDMTEREIPMDRLICGDVGFGKTEVALRAIFRVAAIGRQVMVLTPTTVLAKQHYDVICDRFAGYTMRVALLSRFQTKSERKSLISQIKEGVLDIIVGTHALLGSQIHYNNLGLLVVDEEQRFGVKQKERIASFKTTVDVLTLSATPIPRTLYLALTGFRDASLITTPPPERVPIKTYLSEYHEGKVKAAIEVELTRGGQVFYVLPRIRGIVDKKTFLEILFPGIRVGIAHSRQNTIDLEESMESFAAGEMEILLCTNIIESGLDIQNVNTIIIEDVHLFGLAQLYQLRGRVGRADKEAHAYLFYPCKKLLSDEALERLVALEECCDLGQGFQLAERDMAIRGFGSIFGEEQSGEVAHIGMDLFLEMLFESLSKAEPPTLSQLKLDDVKLDMEFDNYIPSDYIKDLDKRETILHELEAAACSSLKELMHFTNGLRREFGKEPPSVEVLLKALYVRRIAADLGISAIWTRGKGIFLETSISETAFELLKDSVASESIRSSLTFHRGQIELQVLLELPRDRILERILICLIDLRKGLASFVR